MLFAEQRSAPMEGRSNDAIEVARCAVARGAVARWTVFRCAVARGAVVRWTVFRCAVFRCTMVR